MNKVYKLVNFTSPTCLFQIRLGFVLSFLAILFFPFISTAQCYVAGGAAASAPSCGNQSLSLGAGEYRTMSFSAGVYYTFSYANNSQTSGFCVNGVNYTGNPITISPGAGTFNVSMFRANGTWNGSSATLTYRIETPSAPQAVGNITVGPAQGLAGALPDASISASGCWNGGGVNSNCSAGGTGGHEAYRGRLFRSTYVEGGVVAWAVDQLGTNDYWQVDLGSVIPVNGIASQGREECCSQWLTSYSVQTSIDGATWYSVPGTFSANSDGSTVVTNWIGQYHARYVRVTALGYNNHQSARFDVLSIPEGSSASAQTVYASAQLMPNTGEIRWYTAASGGTYLGSGRTIAQNITANTTIYAASYNGGCESGRTAVTLRINDIYGKGPAGVGNTNAKSDLTCWLDGSQINQNIGTAIASWNDQSGYTRNATQGTVANQPSLQTSAGLNNQPVVRFSTAGSADQMSTGNFQSQFGGYSVFSASKLNGGANSRLITSSVRNWLMGYWGGLINVDYNEGWNSAAGCGVGGIAANTNSYIHQVNSTGPNTYFYSNGNVVLGGGGTCGIQSFGGLALGGGCCPGLSEMSDGDIAEIVAYDRAVNEARRLIIQNYLSAKYNTAITNDIYAGDGIGDCDFEVSGVGRESSGIHTSGWSGGLYVSTTLADYLKDNGDYMLFGRNNGTGGWETSNLTTCAGSNPSRRLSRIWYFDKTDVGTAGGNLSMSFDMNEIQGIAPLAGTNYRLMYRAGNTGDFSSVATGSVVGNRINFTMNATSIADGQYTLAYEADIPRAMSFNGSNQYATQVSPSGLPTGSIMSVEAWVKPAASQTSDGTYNGILSFGNRSCNGNALLLSLNSANQVTMATWCNDYTTSGVQLLANQWNHVALTMNGATIQIYLNGVLSASTSLGLVPNVQTGVLNIGSTDNPGRYFNGQLDEVRIWNKVLSAAEISSRMHANIDNTAADWANLRAYYKFDESGGGRIFDLSSNNNNLTAVNSPGVVSLFPATLTDISGTSPSCNGTTEDYTAVVTNSNSRLVYNWVVSGGTINSGQGTNTINVTWGTSGTQNIAVTATHSTDCRTESYNENITIDIPSVAPTGVNGAGSFCPGNVIPLSVVGGSLSGVSTWEWFSGSCGGTAAGSGSSINVSPSNTTAYYVRASANGGCPATSCASGTVTMPSPSNTLGVNLSTATCKVTENNYVHFYDASGRLIMSINSNGQNLGNVDVTSYVNAGGTPTNIQACNTYQPWYVTATLGRNWVATPQFQPSSPVSIRLYYDDAEMGSLATAANTNANPNDDIASQGSLDLSKYSNTTNPALVDGSFSNNCASGSSTVHTPAGFGNINALFGAFGASGRYSDFSISSFSEFWLSGTTNVSPLPIELLSFDAVCLDKKVQLKWETASEINNKQFVVERSSNLQNWEEIGTVNGAGNSNTTLSYVLEDDRPISGLSYYRLTQIDYDGQFETFEPISIMCVIASDGSMMLVYPNPATDKFTVSILASKDIAEASLRLVDINGKEVLSKNISITKGAHEYVFDATLFNPGTYVIKLETSRSNMVIRPIKLVISH